METTVWGKCVVVTHLPRQNTTHFSCVKFERCKCVLHENNYKLLTQGKNTKTKLKFKYYLTYLYRKTIENLTRKVNNRGFKIGLPIACSPYDNQLRKKNYLWLK